MDKLKSRKLWATIVAAVVLLLNKAIGLELDVSTQTSLMAIVSAYLIGQGLADTK